MFVVSFVLLVIPVLGKCNPIGADDDLIIELAQPRSKIRGHVLLSAKGNEYYAFQEIPYAQPPLGEYRFRPPAPVIGWDGILNTTKNTKQCMQISSSDQENQKVAQSEDCLFLNVYTPVKPGSDRSLSVFLFIHGGGFIAGDGTIYSFGPKYLMDGDIIVVTINYRLGPFGFLSTGDNTISGNMGLKDQLLAMSWVHENIYLFGGNPNDIVIGGQSAGAFSIGYHLLNPKSEGLVSASIQQSGSPISVCVYVADPRPNAMSLGKILDQSVDIDNTSSLLPVLQRASAEEILSAYNQVPFPVAPVLENIDADQAIITIPMHQGFMDGDFIRVPSMIGFTSEESVGLLSLGDELVEIAETYDSDVSLIIDPILNVDNKTLVASMIKELYTPSSFAEDLHAFIKYSSDDTIVSGVLRQAELTSHYVPVYVYQLSAGNNTNDKFPGVGHCYDLYYLFTNDYPMFINWQIDEATREMILRLWWNFIKYKNPTPEKDPALQNIEWPNVDPHHLIYLNLNYSLSIESEPRNYTSVRDTVLKYIRPPFFKF